MLWQVQEGDCLSVLETVKRAAFMSLQVQGRALGTTWQLAPNLLLDDKSTCGSN